MIEGLTNDTTCKTCGHRYGHHFRTYEDVPGCSQEVGQSVTIPCPCSGFMMTESETSIRTFHDALGKRVFRQVDAHLKGRKRLTDAVLGPRHA